MTVELLKEKLRRISPERRVLIIFVVAVFLTLLVGGRAWLSVMRLAAGVGENRESEKNVLLVKEIENEIATAESVIKSYTITNETRYLSHYYNHVNNADKKIFELKWQTRNDSTAKWVDSLTKLVLLKFSVLGMYIEQRDTGRVQAILEDLSEKAGTSTTAKASDQNKGFISKLFKRKPEPKLRSGSQWISELETMKYLEEENTRERNEALLAITTKDQEIMQRIRKLVTEMDKQYRLQLIESKMEVEQLSQKTNLFIGVFSFLLAVILGFLAYLIYGYYEKNRIINKKLSAAENEARKLAETRNMFLANMAHEIRTPLHAIIGFSEQIQNQNVKNEPEIRKHAGVIRSASEHLLKLVNNILELSKIQAGKYVRKTQDFHPAEALSEIAVIMKPLAMDRGLEFDFKQKISDDLVVNGDVLSLKQIVINLVSNAIKYSGKGKIKIRAGIMFSQAGKPELMVQVSDQGIGISSEKLEKVYSEFETTGDVSDPKFTSTGLGLAISKKLTDYLGGVLKIDSTEGKGTTVILNVPFEPAADQAEHINGKTMISIPDLKGRNILIADDEPFNILLLEKMLKPTQAKLVTCYAGDEAQRKLETFEFDIAFLDINMPGLNGYEVIEHWNKMHPEKRRNMKFIAVTANSAESGSGKKELPGLFDAVLYKPFTATDLMNLISGYRAENPKNGSAKAHPIPSAVKKSAKSDMWNEILEIAGGDVNFAGEMIRIFIDSTKKNLARLSTALDSDDRKEVKLVAHTMVPSCRHMGFVSVANILKEIENRAGDMPLDQLSAQFRTVNKELAHTVSMMQLLVHHEA